MLVTSGSDLTPDTAICDAQTAWDYTPSSDPPEPAVSSATRRRNARRWFGRILPPAIVLAILVGGWVLIATLFDLPDYILPRPETVGRIALLESRGELLTATGTTGIEILIGFALAVAVGFIIASLIVLSKTFAKGIYPLVIASQTIPVLAIAPILVIWFGFGMTPKILIIVLFGFFPITINTVRGMTSIDADMRYFMKSVGGSRWALFRHVRLPACMPQFFTGAKQTAVIAVIGAIVAEWVGADKGLGPVMISANAALNTALVFAAIFYASVIAIFLFGVVTLVERVSIRWYFIAGAGKEGEDELW